MPDPKDPTVDCSCKIPVCLEFVHATATDDFKIELQALLSNLCNDDSKIKVSIKAE